MIKIQLRIRTGPKNRNKHNRESQIPETPKPERARRLQVQNFAVQIKPKKLGSRKASREIELKQEVTPLQHSK